MLEGINVNQRIKYSLKRDKNNPTVFVIKPLSGLEVLELFGDGKSLSSDSIRKILESSIVEVHNFEGPTNVCEIINTLNIDDVSELLSKINEINDITNKDKKKS